MVNSASSDNEPVDYIAWFAFGVMALSMSLSFVFVKISLEGFTLAQSIGGRIVLGAALLVPLALIFGGGLPLRLVFWKWACIIAAINFVFQTCQLVLAHDLAEIVACVQQGELSRAHQ